VIETWLARSFIVIIAALMLFIAGAGISVFSEYYRRFKHPAGLDDSFNSQGWTALVVCAVLEVLLAAVMDVGQAFALVSEGWGAIVGITGTLLLPILGYKSVQAIQATKGGPTNVTGGGG
jgi:hypothetical protein